MVTSHVLNATRMGELYRLSANVVPVINYDVAYALKITTRATCRAVIRPATMSMGRSSMRRCWGLKSRTERENKKGAPAPFRATRAMAMRFGPAARRDAPARRETLALSSNRRVNDRSR